MMELLEIAQTSAFLHHALTHLKCHEAQNNLLLSSTLNLNRGGTTRGLRYFVGKGGHDRAKVSIAALQIGTRLFISQSDPESSARFALEIRKRHSPAFLHPASVFGELETAQIFSHAWRQGSCDSSPQPQISLHHCVLVLDPGELLIHARQVSGEMQIASTELVSTVSNWSKAFVQECRLTDSEEETEHSARQFVDRKMIYVWHDQKPASMAALSGETDRFMRISQVYTPIALRGHGYASELVWKMSEKILDRQKSAMLMTEKSNALANRLYERIGFKKIGEFAEFTLNTITA